MADLPTITAGNFVAGEAEFTDFTGTEPVLQSIAGANDGTNVHDTENSTHTGTAVFSLGNTPADFGSMDTLFVQIRYGLGAAPGNNTWDSLTVQILRSDLTTPLTNERTIASNIAHTPSTSAVLQFTGVDTDDAKAIWDGALLRLRFGITRNKGGDSVEERVTALQLTGEYTAGAPSPTEVTDTPTGIRLSGPVESLVVDVVLVDTSSGSRLTGPTETVTAAEPVTEPVDLFDVPTGLRLFGPLGSLDIGVDLDDFPTGLRLFGPSGSLDIGVDLFDVPTGLRLDGPGVEVVPDLVLVDAPNSVRLGGPVETVQTAATLPMDITDTPTALRLWAVPDSWEEIIATAVMHTRDRVIIQRRHGAAPWWTPPGGG
jgi:hypothetical protein